MFRDCTNCSLCQWWRSWIRSNTPETDRFGNDPRVEMEFGIGGTDKKNSSSWLLHNYFERQRKMVGI